jgi:surface protein
MESMFWFNNAFNQNIGAWDVSNVTTFASMFNRTTAFNNGGSADINNWTIRTASAVNMASMFVLNSSFNQPIGSWNTSAVNNMSSMFTSATAFNQNIGAWNVSSVTSFASMFNNARLFNQNIGSWNVSSCTSFESMFVEATAFNNGGSADINNWTIRTTSAVNMAVMFGGFSDLISCKFNQPIGNWNTSAVTNMSDMFLRNSGFNQDIGNWDVSNVTNFTRFMEGKSAANYSPANLDSIYNGWSSRPVKPNISINFGSIKYTAAGQAGKDILLGAPNLWIISDGGI